MPWRVDKLLWPLCSVESGKWKATLWSSNCWLVEMGLSESCDLQLSKSVPILIKHQFSQTIKITFHFQLLTLHKWSGYLGVPLPILRTQQTLHAHTLQTPTKWWGVIFPYLWMWISICDLQVSNVPILIKHQFSQTIKVTFHFQLFNDEVLYFFICVISFECEFQQNCAKAHW